MPSWAYLIKGVFYDHFRHLLPDVVGAMLANSTRRNYCDGTEVGKQAAAQSMSLICKSPPRHCQRQSGPQELTLPPRGIDRFGSHTRLWWQVSSFHELSFGRGIAWLPSDTRWTQILSVFRRDCRPKLCGFLQCNVEYWLSVSNRCADVCATRDAITLQPAPGQQIRWEWECCFPF